MKVFKPTGTLKPIEEKPSKGLGSLEHKTIGFLDNRKTNFDLFLDRLEALMTEKYHITAVRRAKENPAVSMGPALLEEMSEKCAAVVTGSAD